MKGPLRASLIFVFALIGAVFAWLNAGDVTIRLGVAAFEAPLSILVLAAMLIGWVLGVLTLMPRLWRGRHREAPPPLPPSGSQELVSQSGNS